jgi:hypothetical protein
MSILSMVFLPLALFGLFRLPAAYWLIGECAFADARDDVPHQHRHSDQSARLPFLGLASFNKEGHTSSTAAELQSFATGRQELQHTTRTALERQKHVLERSAMVTKQSIMFPRLQTALDLINDSSTRFYPASHWRGIVVRVLFMIPLLGMVSLALFCLFHLFLAGSQIWVSPLQDSA